jgi:hypothetical protein
VKLTANRRISALLLASAVVALAPGAASLVQAQTQPGAATVDTAQTAQEVRKQFMAVLRKYPPTLGRVLKLDPGLIANDAYLVPYPALKAFLTTRPDVVRNPAYYLEEIQTSYYDYYRSPGQQMFEDLMTGVLIFTVTAVVLGAFTWLVRTLIDYRRWHRLSKVQAETHTKLLDRFTANDELMAYVQSPAGSRFLQSAPIALDPGTRAVSAPFGRILLSAQAGVVLAAAGLGFYYVSGRVDEEMMQPLYTLGILGLFVGIGFMASAFVSFVLSKRLGLFEPPAPPAGLVGRQDS